MNKVEKLDAELKRQQREKIKWVKHMLPMELAYYLKQVNLKADRLNFDALLFLRSKLVAAISMIDSAHTQEFVRKAIRNG